MTLFSTLKSDTIPAVHRRCPSNRWLRSDASRGRGCRPGSSPRDLVLARDAVVVSSARAVGVHPPRGDAHVASLDHNAGRRSSGCVHVSAPCRRVCEGTAKDERRHADGGPSGLVGKDRRTDRQSIGGRERALPRIEHRRLADGIDARDETVSYPVLLLTHPASARVRSGVDWPPRIAVSARRGAQRDGVISHLGGVGRFVLAYRAPSVS